MGNVNIDIRVIGVIYLNTKDVNIASDWLMVVRHVNFFHES
jgi:hypothetical protein